MTTCPKCGSELIEQWGTIYYHCRNGDCPESWACESNVILGTLKSRIVFLESLLREIEEHPHITSDPKRSVPCNFSHAEGHRCAAAIAARWREKMSSYLKDSFARYHSLSPSEAEDALKEIDRLEKRIAELEAELAKCKLKWKTGKQVPEIVCLCGSTRFKDTFDDQNYHLTMSGSIVLTVGFFMHASGNRHGESIGCTPEQKKALDELHKRKIDLCDRVFVLNVGGYIGESTRSEINYAHKNGKPVTYLEPQEGE